MRRQLFKLAIVSAVTGLSLGTAAVAGASSINTTGPDSENEVSHKIDAKLDVDNNNHIHVTNNNPQYASTGEAEVEHNTTGGDARSGDVENDSELSASVSINNSVGVGGFDSFGDFGDMNGSISNTGPDSENEIEFEAELRAYIDNNNYIDITNNNHQTATSGEASVEGNTTGGDAVSGDASNTSNTSVNINVTN